MGIALGLYEKLAIGAESACVAGASGVPDLEAFQIVVAEFDALESEGLLKIIERHKESQSGQRHVDLVRYRRIR